MLHNLTLRQLIGRNPLDGVELPKPEKKPPPIVERDAITKLLERARGTRLFPFILLALATGARRGELLALIWTDRLRNRNHVRFKIARADEVRLAGEEYEVRTAKRLCRPCGRAYGVRGA